MPQIPVDAETGKDARPRHTTPQRCPRCRKDNKELSVSSQYPNGNDLYQCNECGYIFTVKKEVLL